MLRGKRLILIGLGVFLCSMLGIYAFYITNISRDARQSTTQLRRLLREGSADTNSKFWESTAFFEKTGLLAHHGETAPEILMRAHKRETGAMFLAAMGYVFGICGFPPNTFLASAWAGELKLLGDAGAAGYILLLTGTLAAAGDSAPPDLSYGPLHKVCMDARDFSHAAFYDAALHFDMNGICELAEKYWELTASEEEKEAMKNSFEDEEKKEAESIRVLMRELRSRPATLDEQDAIIGFILQHSPDVALFFAATDHNPKTGPPDWSSEKLLPFLDVQREQLEKELKADNREMWPAFIDLIYEGGNVFARRSRDMPEDVDIVIYRAHLGDIPSIRAVAEYYADGRAGFIKSRMLSNLWLQHAAMYGDQKAAFAVAVYCFTLGDLNPAWFWASRILNSENADMEIKANARILVNKIEKIQGDEEEVVRGREILKGYITDACRKLSAWMKNKK